mmetsp:Transcript_31457/g.57133  ORF Transcript_31457/g.57133 Transcript_31457/m.57133 type:complete len:116 (-) Transcript_31457:95-442(-)
MLCHLRGDFNLDNIVEYNESEQAPLLGADQSASKILKLQTFLLHLFPVGDYFGIKLKHLDSRVHVIGGLSEEERQTLGEQKYLNGVKKSALENTRVITLYTSICRMMMKHLLILI